MTFDQSVVLGCVAVPAAMMLVAVLVAWQGRSTQDVSSLRNRILASGVAVTWCISVWVAVTYRQGLQWMPDEFWRLLFYPALGWAVWTYWLVGRNEEEADRPGPWIVAGLLASWLAWTAMPAGEDWQDTFELRRAWMPALMASCLLNSWFLYRMSRHGAQRWVMLVALAALGGPTILAASVYASLAECGVAALVATGIVAAAATIVGSIRLSVVAFPTIAFAAGLTAAGRFYSYEEHPAMIYAAMLFLPAVVGAADWPMRQRAVWLRVGLAATISSAIVGACLWFILLRETESW